MRVLWITLSLMLASCSREGAFKGGENETKPAAEGLPLVLPKEGAGRQLIFHGYYDVNVSRKSDGLVVCTGPAEIITYTDMTVIKGKVPCTERPLYRLAVKEIPIGDGVERPATMVSPEEMQERNLDERVRFVTKVGQATFNPQKPDLLGPLIQEPSSYEGLDIEQEYTVKFQTGKSERPEESAQGKTRVRVHETNGTYRPSVNLPTFENVIHYSINSQGFDGLSNKSILGIYQTYEYRWRTRPMQLLGIHIEGPVQDFEENELKGFAGNLIFGGGIVIDIRLREFHTPDAG